MLRKFRENGLGVNGDGTVKFFGEAEMGKKVCPYTSTEQYWKGSHIGGTGMGKEKLAPSHSIPF